MYSNKCIQVSSIIAERLSVRRIILQHRRSEQVYVNKYKLAICRSEMLGKDRCTVALILVKIVVQ